MGGRGLVDWKLLRRGAFDLIMFRSFVLLDDVIGEDE